MPQIIICAGEELTPRWNNYLGVTRHMVPANGEPIIHRMQRQVLSRGFDDVVVMCDSKRKTDYIVDPRVKHTEPPVRTGDLRENSVVWAYRNYITKDRSTVFLFGDTYYSDEFVDHLASHSSKELVIYRSKGQQHPYQSPEPEILAIVISAKEADIFVKNLEEMLPAFRAALEKGRAVPAGLVASALNELWKTRRKYNAPILINGCVQWSDLTDDFDRPEDWDLKHRYFPEIFTRP